MAAVELPDLTSPSGLQHLDQFLLTKSYISGHQPSKDDVFVHCALQQAPGSDLTNASRWYNHISALLEKCFPGTPVGVQVQGAFSAVQTRELPNGTAAPAPGTPAPKTDAETRELPKGTAAPAPGTPAPKTDAEVGGDDDDDLDLFGEETEEEKKASEEREAKKKASGKKKESGKSSVLLDVKPWDDETDMVKLEEAVRSVSMAGLHWGASKLAPVGYGIKKLQIMMTVEDDLVSVDNLIEDYLIEAPRNEFIQSCDIVAFNKI